MIYTLEFSFMSRIPGMLWENGIQPTEVMQLEVSKVEGRDRGAAGALDFLWPGGAGITHKKRALFSGKEGNLCLDKAPASAYNILN